jgi:squalene cyclase
MIFAYKAPEARRKAFVFTILKKNGKLSGNESFFLEFINEQKVDGGWYDVFETAVTSYLIRDSLPFGLRYKSALEWLKGQKTENTAWGYSQRDIPRIPVTGFALTLLPELADEASLSWLEKEWAKDLHSETKLTYKGAFTLMAFASTKYTPGDPSLIADTVEYLISEQNEDGGFAPWKGHPVGSEPWSTGIDLIGLLSFPELIKPEIIEKTLDWLAKNQLPNGLWPCHYLEEGSSYCYWGVVEALKYLKRISR